MTWEFCFDIFIAKFEQGTFKISDFQADLSNS